MEKIQELKLSISMDGEILTLEDSRAFLIQQFISSEFMLVSQISLPHSLYLFNMVSSTLRVLSPLKISEVSFRCVVLIIIIVIIPIFFLYGFSINFLFNIS